MIGKIIEIKDLDYAIEFIKSQKEEWHRQRITSLHPDFEKVKEYD